MEADAAQRAGFVKKYNFVGSGQGTVVRIVEWAPGHAMFPHRTETVDYSMVLSKCHLTMLEKLGVSLDEALRQTRQ
jgi:hypothetical protein